MPNTEHKNTRRSKAISATKTGGRELPVNSLPANTHQLYNSAESGGIRGRNAEKHERVPLNPHVGVTADTIISDISSDITSSATTSIATSGAL
jgi:hypothetical protein